MRALLRAGLLLFVAAFTLTGCGGGSDATSGGTTPTEASTGTGTSDDPTDCMEQAGIANVEEEPSDVWSGSDLSDGATVIVARKASAAEAKQAARDAKLFYTATVGQYFVQGNMRAEGASGSVTAIAGCLRGS